MIMVAITLVSTRLRAACWPVWWRLFFYFHTTLLAIRHSLQRHPIELFVQLVGKVEITDAHMLAHFESDGNLFVN